ncbi:ATP-dependent Clp protease adaptor ClpS, partial [Escherichia coli]|uniref:ATP-dependent Clp protease adaptor ClpS n=1 Tax=Escherichia coli TaxID=562 RepID=UPI001CDAB2A5
MGKTNDWLDFDQLAEEKVRDALKPPSMYKVILVNDDYTPMEFVIDVLQKFFSYDVERATQLMLAVHYQGKAGFAPIFPDTCYHLTHYWLAAVDIPV